MWTALAVVVVIVGVAGLLWRLAVIPRRTPDENDRSRQHEVPGTDRSPPPD